MPLPIPALSDYGISPTHGFLPSTLPLTHLSDPYYEEWESIATELQDLICNRRLRDRIDGLRELSTKYLKDDAEWRRAYSLLCFTAHGYIWGGEAPRDRLPRQISIPLLDVSRRLDIPPVATYAAVCLWNYKPQSTDGDVDNLENLDTLFTFTGSVDESWFYLISVNIEVRGAFAIPLMLRAIEAARQNNSAVVTQCLLKFSKCLVGLTSILQRIHERCKPAVFYHCVRPFLAGSKNMANAGLPRGVIYDDGTDRKEYQQYSGGSNAQSSIIQFFDVVLGIQHRTTGEKSGTLSQSVEHDDSAKRNFIQDMRKYMPGPHARFLEDVSHVANIHEYVQQHTKNTELCLAYNACLANLRTFRNKHIVIAARYIITPSNCSHTGSSSAPQSPEVACQLLNLANASLESEGKSHKGTGGTALMPFLKQARDETLEPAIAISSRQR